jgi:hypothetical protein
METMHRDNIKATMNAIRNFFLWVLLRFDFFIGKVWTKLIITYLL